MTSEQRSKWYAENLRDKYNRILAQNGSLTDKDYENMINDVASCVEVDSSTRDALFNVLEEFDRRNRK